jgi:3-oxoacyl-[acyl-carrier-protein] synthase II
VQLFADPEFPDRDVLVTGIGIVCPGGSDRESAWRHLRQGSCAARWLTTDEIDFLPELQKLRGVPAAGFPVSRSLLHEQIRQLQIPATIPTAVQTAWFSEPLIAMTLVALQEAVNDAHLNQPLSSDVSTGCFFGASKGGMRTAEQLTSQFVSASAPCISEYACTPAYPAHTEVKGPGNLPLWSDIWSSAFTADAAARAIAAVFPVRNALSSPVAACATGLISVLQAAASIHSGQCEVCIAGSADAALRASVLASFHRLRVTSRSSDPQTACRPFDTARDGFLVGEGAAVLILESRRHAAARGVRSYGRVTAGGFLNDPTGMTQVDSSGSVVAELLLRTRRALDQLTERSGSASASTSSIDYLNLHGTATEANDSAEAHGVFQAFGPSAPRCSGMKGAIGHLLGAAGAVETALTLLALRDQLIPGTRGLNGRDESLPLTNLIKTTEAADLRRVLKLSLGFGGHVAAGVFDAES